MKSHTQRWSGAVLAGCSLTVALVAFAFLVAAFRHTGRPATLSVGTREEHKAQWLAALSCAALSLHVLARPPRRSAD